MADRGTDTGHCKAGARKRVFQLFEASASPTISGLLHEIEAASAADEA